MHRRTLGLIIGSIAALSLVGVGVAGASSQAKPRSGGQVIFGADQEPNSLNPVTEDHFWASMINSMSLVGSHVLTPALEFKPLMISRPVVVQKKPLRLTYHIKKNAYFYENGKRRPVTAADYIFTWRLITNKNVESVSTVGYEDISRAISYKDKKKVTFVFKKPFAGYVTLFNQILPRYALSNKVGEQFTDVFRNDLNNPNTGKPVANGPFLLQSWRRGQNATLTRNPSYGLTRRAYLGRVVVKFLKDTQTTATQIRGGEVDVIYPQPQTFLVPLRQDRRLKVQVGLGPVWEHIDINFGYGKGDPALRKRFVREAIFRGINRQSIVDTLYKKTGIAPNLKVLNSLIIVGNQKGYKPHFAQYKYNPATARSILTRAGCTRGGDGIFTCQGQKLRFRLSTTGGNQQRVLAEQIIQEQLKAVGIDIDIVNDPGRLLFDKRLPEGDYDLAMYAWVGSPDITGWDNIYGCRNDATKEGQQNRQGYCNSRVNKLLKQVNATFSIPGQLKLTNQAIALMAKDINNIPLFQKPTYLIHKRAIGGPKENPTSAGPVWNIEYWHRTTL